MQARVLLHTLFDPSLTYGRRKPFNHYEHQRFVPHYALFSRKCLSFDAYFRQGIFGSPAEQWRVRRVKIVYYLEDDTMAVTEPKLENAGFKQGKLVKRDKVPKWQDPEGRCYHWKDFNVGMNIAIYGVVYRIYDCDAFTREFLTSQGIDVSHPEDVPPDPYLRNRFLQEQQSALNSTKYISRSLADDRRYRFLEYDGMILSFDASWNDDIFKLRYFLADDTIAVCEVRRPNDGKDNERGCLLLKRMKVPKNWKDLPANYPSAYLEKSDKEIREFYSPSDLKVGETVFLFGRKFLLHDCDPFTRRYYSSMLRFDQPPRIPLPNESTPSDYAPKPLTAKLDPDEEPKKDLIRRLYNFPKKLRYSLCLDAVRREDEGRQFVLEYSLAEGTIRICEFAQRNSGRKGGCFLGWIRVPKPGTEEYYTPEDFAIGSRLNVFGHWFIVTGTEPFVYKYMRANPQKFNEELRRGARDYLKEKGWIDAEEGEVTCGKVDVEQKNEEEHVCGVEKAKEITWAKDCL
ncbi:hypothetical protein TSAR_000406 [Trichomalopsis sarcophagae]|uniref:DM10 domain-containing protein n=1 Tax=Trichomalopsis sarcophagae TaxID=543379 RepID=A0A232FDL5_9HYME|nr:hypothetical protein TSAR_000406 [Trichomalopsis sarcophagae]